MHICDFKLHSQTHFEQKCYNIAVGEKGLTLARNKLAAFANVEQGGEERMQICILVSTPQM